MNITRNQQKEIDKIFNQEQILFAYLFGSQANNTAVKNSDVDIAVMFDKKVLEDERFER